MKAAIAVLVCLLMISPVSAATYQLSAIPASNQEVKVVTGVTDYTFDVTSTRAIQQITLDMPSDTTADFTLTYGAENTVSGWGKYLHAGQVCNGITGNAYCNYNEVSIGGDTKGYNFMGLSEIGHLNIIGYARRTDDNTTGIIVYDDVLGLNNPSSSTAYFDTGVATNIIYKIHVVSDKPIKITVYTNDRTTLQGTVSSTPSEIFGKWVNFAIGLSSMVWSLLNGLVYWIGFFFVGKNLILIVELYLAGSMAITAWKVKGNPAAFLPKFFKDQKALFEFMLGIWKMLIESVGTIIGWFRLI
jgi:hypothetical protein